MNIFKIGTQPKEKWYQKYLLRLLLRYLIMVPFANGKITHWWNWYKSNLIPQKAILIKSDPLATNRLQKDKISLIRASLGGWQKIAVIKPSYAYQNWHWRIGFETKEGDKTIRQFCNIFCAGTIRVLIGPNDIKFFGLDKNGSEIKLELVATSTRGDKNFKNIPLI